MAYTLFPTKTADILKIKPDPIRGGEIVELFGYLKRKYKTVKTPINIDLEKSGLGKNNNPANKPMPIDI